MSEEESMENSGEITEEVSEEELEDEECDEFEFEFTTYNSKTFTIEAESIEEAEAIAKRIYLSGEWWDSKYGEMEWETIDGWYCE